LLDIYKAYDTGGISLEILHEVNITVWEGEFVTIMGASGSGKTTLLNILGCLDRPSSGSYLFKGEQVEDLDDNQLSHLRNRYIGFVFQSFNLLPRLPAWRNVELPLIYQEVPASKRKEIAAQMLTSVGLGQKANRLPGELSGGEQQRIAIARALASQPSLLLADEPTGNLDSKTGTEIIGILQGLHQKGLTIIMVTHSPEMAVYSNRTIVIRDGRIVEGAP
jgi:putative ABC transport system ATP-binding protein